MSELKSRQKIDGQLVTSGWIAQGFSEFNLSASHRQAEELDRRELKTYVEQTLSNIRG